MKTNESAWRYLKQGVDLYNQLLGRGCDFKKITSGNESLRQTLDYWRTMADQVRMVEQSGPSGGAGFFNRMTATISSLLIEQDAIDGSHVASETPETMVKNLVAAIESFRQSDLSHELNDEAAKMVSDNIYRYSRVRENLISLCDDSVRAEIEIVWRHCYELMSDPESVSPAAMSSIYDGLKQIHREVKIPETYSKLKSERLISIAIQYQQIQPRQTDGGVTPLLQDVDLCSPPSGGDTPVQVTYYESDDEHLPVELMEQHQAVSGVTDQRLPVVTVESRVVNASSDITSAESKSSRLCTSSMPLVADQAVSPRNSMASVAHSSPVLNHGQEKKERMLGREIDENNGMID